MRRTAVCRVGVAVLVCVMASLSATAAGTLPVWRAPAGVSAEGEDPQGLQLLDDAQGEAVALWRNETNSYYGPLELASRSPGSVWQRTSPLRSAHGVPVGDPAVAVERGNVVIATASQEFVPGSQGAYSTGDVVVRAVVGPLAGVSRQYSVGLSRRGRIARDPQVAIDGEGDAVVVWEEAEKAQSTSAFALMAAVRPASSGEWRSSVRLASSISTYSGSEALSDHEARAPSLSLMDNLQVAVDARGDAVVVWEQASNTGARAVESVTGSLMSGAWRKRRSLGTSGRRAETVCGVWVGPPPNPHPGLCTTAALYPSAEPSLAIDSRGDAVVVWAHAEGAQTTLRAVVSRTRGTTWQAPTRVVSAEPHIGSPQLKLDANGEAVLAWTEIAERETAVQVTSGLPTRKLWRAPVRLATWSYTSPPPCRAGACNAKRVARPLPSVQIAIGLHGEAVAVWNSLGLAPHIYAAVKPAGRHAWRRARMVSAEGSEPEVAVGARGEAIAAWVGRRRIPEQSPDVPCEAVVRAAVLMESKIAPRRPRPVTPACSTTAP
jgi:hypothetical protein